MRFQFQRSDNDEQCNRGGSVVAEMNFSPSDVAVARYVVASLVELARLYTARAIRISKESKVVDLSANLLPFLVIHVAYLISASWLARVCHNRMLDLEYFGCTKIQKIRATK